MFIILGIKSLGSAEVGGRGVGGAGGVAELKWAVAGVTSSKWYKRVLVGRKEHAY